MNISRVFRCFGQLLSSVLVVAFLFTGTNGQLAKSTYTNPFVPIYTKGDDLSHANPKPKVIYEEVPGTKVVIPNMPAVKTQDELMGGCLAFSLAALMQWYTCNEWKIADCKNLPENRAISYFGAAMYTHHDPNQRYTFQPDQSKAQSMYDILKHVKSNGGGFILESCISTEKVARQFSGVEGIERGNEFKNYLRGLYVSNKNKKEAEISDCSACVNEINTKAGLNLNVENLKKALAKESYDEFMYSLFFRGCKLKGFPAHYLPRAYPYDSLNITKTDLKNKAIAVLKSGKPVWYPHLCTRFRSDNYCDQGHSIVISGYKRACETTNRTRCKDVFKVHNSWGDSWQRLHNDGWTDADQIVNNVYKKDIKNPNSVASGSLLWLGDGSDYELQN